MMADHLATLEMAISTLEDQRRELDDMIFQLKQTREGISNDARDAVQEATKAAYKRGREALFNDMCELQKKAIDDPPVAPKPQSS